MPKTLFLVRCNDAIYRYISSIETGQTADTLLVTLSNYGIPSVFVSSNGGDSWKEIEGNLPDMPVRYGIFHPQSAHQVMLATETGSGYRKRYLTIRDLNGRLVRSMALLPGTTHLPIDLQNEAKGVYLVKIEHAGGSAVRRVVVGS